MARDATAPELGGRYVRVGQLADLQRAECAVVQVKEHTLALFSRGEHIYAVDNRCPGFPLNRGTVKEGILTCHWHS
jgi:nitrite reductase/ring-hydroxylating ferredoxin subunit